MSDRDLNTELQFLKGVGPRMAISLSKLGLRTVGDLLNHFPRRYDDRRNVPKIASLTPGSLTSVRGFLRSVESRPTRGGMVIQKVILNDGTGNIALTWFNQPWVERQLREFEGEVIAYGIVKEGSPFLEIGTPEWETIEDGDAGEEFQRIVPVYPLSEGVSQKMVRRATRSAIDLFAESAQDPLSPKLLERLGMPSLLTALRDIHWPATTDEQVLARRRLVFEEFFYLQLTMAMRRMQTQIETGISFPISELVAGKPPSITPTPPKAKGKSLFAESAPLAPIPLWAEIEQMLPFKLTGAQNRVVQEIWADMEQPHPMNRLLQGDVGSGKTAVAACCILAAVRSGYQAALMVPTEILAEQHAANLERFFSPLGIEVALLLGKQGAKARRAANDLVRTGQASVVIGTHALIQESVEFHKLGFVIIDEQHRFGVMQRKALRDKSFGNPDVLVMTATPIPRTLTMTVYGDLQVSIIDELPPGRQPIKTVWRRSHDREIVYAKVREIVNLGQQAYFVCPMIGESEKLMAQAAEELFNRLSSGPFRDFTVGLLHGQLKPVEKDAVMDKFRLGETQVLVSTTVIEVGVDVPNATVMVIEDANRFGLAQMHQLRGRVGRGGAASYCILIADTRGEETKERLEVLVSTQDGFKIAEADLRLRGPGSMAGTQQSGNWDLKIGDFLDDSELLLLARTEANRAVDRDPQLTSSLWPPILARIEERRRASSVINVS